MRWDATIIDISQGGVRVKLQRRFERGAGLAIELPGDAEQEACVVFVKVVHVKAQDDGTWALGCKFISDLGDGEVQRLLSADKPDASAVKGDSPETRFLTDVTVEIEVDQETPVRCRIKRLDATKCWPVAPGKTLSISGAGRNGVPWVFKIEVVHLSQQDGQWRLQSRLAESKANSGLLRVLGRLSARSR